MPDPFLDHLPGHEREKMRKRMRSPESYAESRESVKGPEDLEKEMLKNAEFAEVSLALETQPEIRDKLRDKLKEDMSFDGPEKVIDGPVSSEVKKALESGRFDVKVDAQAHAPRLAISIDAPSGNVAEKLPLKPNYQDQIMASFKLQKRQSNVQKKGR